MRLGAHPPGAVISRRARQSDPPPTSRRFNHLV